MFKYFKENPLKSIINFQLKVFKGIQFSNYQFLIKSLFSKLILEFNSSKKENTEIETTNQCDEKKAIEKFLQNNKPSYIHRIFYSIKETISSCIECNMKTFNFEYIPFILIESNKERKNI